MSEKSNLPRFKDFIEPKDYFMAYCKAMNYNLLTMRSDGSIFLVEFYDKDEKEVYLDLVFCDCDGLAEDAVFLASCNKSNPTECCIIELLYSNFVMLSTEQKRRFEKLKKDFLKGGVE